MSAMILVRTGALLSKDPNYEPFRRSGQFIVHPIDSNYLLFGSSEGFFTSPDRGQTWQRHLSSLVGTSPYKFAAHHRNGTIVVAGYDKQLYWTQDYGESWFVMASSPTGGTLQPGLAQPLAFDPDSGSIWYADLGRSDITTGPRSNGVFSTHDRGQTWLPAFVDNKALAIDYIDFIQSAETLTVYVASPTKAYYSDDKGKVWNNVSIQWGGLPDGVEGGERETNHSTLVNAYTLVNAHTRDGMLYLKTRKGLLKSIDNGSRWFY